MKYFFTTLLLLASFITKAQWSNTTNQFYDSLAMTVTSAAGDQINPIILKSYPDSGYFIIWSVGKNPSNNNKIYAQKYDKNGSRLWPEGGVSIATSSLPLLDPANNGASSNNGPDWRNYSFTATDSANGFYIAYQEGSYNDKLRVMAQHIRDDGTPVFADDGFTVHYDANSNLTGWAYPQLIPDGNRGFFIGYIIGGDLGVECYKDENGTMKKYGGGTMNYNAEEYPQDSICQRILVGIVHPAIVVDYMLYPNLQSGCGVAMSLNITADKNGNGGRYFVSGINELVRIKKDAVANGIQYIKDEVMPLYQVRSRYVDLPCVGGTGIVRNFVMLTNGFLVMSAENKYQTYIRASMLPTDGNINVNVFADIESDSYPVTNPVVKVHYWPSEKYDDIPYGYKTGPYYCECGAPAGEDILNSRDDTLFYSGGKKIYDFALKHSGNRVFATAFADLVSGSTRSVLLQQLKLERTSPNSFDVSVNTNNKFGVTIANEVFNLVPIFYHQPQITVDGEGSALLYVYENEHYIRVSPLGDNAHVEWGAVGKPLGGPFYDPSDKSTVPYAVMSPKDGTAVIAWYGFGNTGKHPPDNDIMMRHLDSLQNPDYTPPVGKIKPFPYPGKVSAFPNNLLGLSGEWTVFNYTNNNPIAALKDDNSLGEVGISVYRNAGAIRLYKGQPYLDRNYTITPQIQPTILQPVRLYFSTAEMDAMKAADPTITGPDMLQIVKQPSASPDAPGSFTPSANDEIINPASWGTVDGGYYLEVNVNSFSNFFIQKINGPLPVIWLNVNAKWKDNQNAIVSWNVGVQSNVKQYNVQHSLDGVQFTNVCEVAPDNSHLYVCTVTADQDKIHYFRIQQTDVDGRINLSKIVTLHSQSENQIVIYPNPVDNLLHVDGCKGFDEIIIYDFQGKILQRKKITQAKMAIDVSRLAVGNYILEVAGNQKTNRFKFIKQP